MAKKKKQHYVPKFYLRFFSINSEGKQLKLCLKKSGEIIQQTELSSQAQESYFYGKDLERENWFGTIEDTTAIILRKVVRTKELPKSRSDDYYWIWLFMLLQAYRTRAQANEFNDLVDKSIKTAMQFEPQFAKFEYDKLFFAYDDAVERNLEILLNSLPIMLDMEIKLLENNTGQEFITSDNPISKYNQFLESRNFLYGHNGMASKGLQIFYPLAPNLMLIMYDPRIYKVGSKKQFSGIPVNKNDINGLNLLTSLYAHKTLFSTNNVTDFQFQKLLKKSSRFHDQKKLESKYFNSIPNEENTQPVVVQHHKKPYQLKLDLSFVRQTQHAKSYKLSGYYAEIRDERLRNR